ncbi:NUDIX domain-containing protein [Actinacidiphila rubida]|uniref:8-oxo-dGTP pyrophosphatase MutT, NUDIX family n=1 Tax=Actinacidiphila rubida TaxID=310780 RepID=A0A1H8QM61_9ACTN|nr:8-oxo-dGTP pyrophosphatase MutT, NUDIX family [Actinacidiphila rubida]
MSSPSSSTTGRLAPGRPLPLTPQQVLQSVPHHTVFACLYLRDEHDHPLLLRPSYGPRHWQVPGGMAEAGEDPLTTARRETAEETGLDLGHGDPRLLIVPYLHPDAAWPLGKIGFFFDGGRLTRHPLDRIRLDPTEHELWALHGLDTWQNLMSPDRFARLHALEHARLSDGPGLAVAGPCPLHPQRPATSRKNAGRTTPNYCSSQPGERCRTKTVSGCGWSPVCPRPRLALGRI